MEGVAAVNVTASFVAGCSGEIVEDSGPPPLGDRPRRGLRPTLRPPRGRASPRLVGATWERLEAHIVAVGNGGIVLLHDAAPLAHYTGGGELLARLAVAARQAGEAPRGLWLFCPMQSPKDSPRLDDVTVAVIPGDAEQLFVPDSFADPQGGPQGIMIDPPALLEDLKRQVKHLEADLRQTGVPRPTPRSERNGRRPSKPAGPPPSSSSGSRTGHPGRRRLDPRHRLRPLLRRQRPARAPLHRRPWRLASPRPANSRRRSSPSIRARTTTTGSSGRLRPCRCPRSPGACSTETTTRCG